MPTLAMDRVMEAPPKQPKAIIAPEVPSAVQPVLDAPETDAGVATVSPAPQDHLQELLKQYLQALYRSRTSLAYFTKGPLSRARAAFTSIDASLDTTQLVDFLRDAILTSTVMDKKYRDGLAAIVKGWPMWTPDTPEQSAKVKKKKKKWKSKRDKGGFFADEQDSIEQWWQADDETGTNSSSAETVDGALKRRLPAVRNRETFLQIILALEVLALESSKAASHFEVKGTEPAAAAPEAQDQVVQAKNLHATADVKKPRSKKKHDLPALLETLLDKLCIWHSLEAHSPAKKARNDGDNSEHDVNDELRGFCIEVIVPFYVSRVPDYAAIVNKKLGGPSAPTPVKRKQTSTRRPGEPAFRQQPEKKPRQPLARVSTDTLNQTSRRPPLLHRSATDSQALAVIKRESSEAPMDSIPQAKPQRAAPRQRASLLHQISFSKREVDLSAMSQVSDAKMRKKADVEEKLREAISTLKKPNRALAVKDIADSTDESFAKATSRSRQSQALRSKAAQGTISTATPKHVRTVKATPHRRAIAATAASVRTSESSTTHVPSTSTRSIAQPSGPPHGTFAVPQTGHRPRHGTSVEETPSRGFAKFMPAGLAREPGTLESPIASRTAAVQQTPLKPVKTLAFDSVRQGAEVGVTPLRPPTQAVLAASPNLARLRGEQGDAEGSVGQGSVYDTLGWNEEYEDLS